MTPLVLAKKVFPSQTDWSQVEQDTGVAQHQSHGFLESSVESRVWLCARQSLLVLSPAFPLASASVTPLARPFEIQNLLWPFKPTPTSCLLFFTLKQDSQGQGLGQAFPAKGIFLTSVGMSFQKAPSECAQK